MIKCRLCGNDITKMDPTKDIDKFMIDIQTHLATKHKDKMGDFMVDLLECGKDNEKLLHVIDTRIDISEFLPKEQAEQAMKEIYEDKDKEKVRESLKLVEEEIGISMPDMLKMVSEFMESFGKHEEIVEAQYTEILSRISRLEKIMYAWATKEGIVALKNEDIATLIVEWKQQVGH